MNEKEAWRFILNEWDDCQEHFGTYRVKYEEKICHGLCDIIHKMGGILEIISESTRDSMISKINYHFPLLGPFDFAWSIHDEEGKQSRIQFCKDRIEELS